jgi:hypothetical protein
MSPQIKIKISPDGKIQAEVAGVKGKKCTDYIKVLEEMLGAIAVNSTFTPEAYETETLRVESPQEQKIGEGSCG